MNIFKTLKIFGVILVLIILSGGTSFVFSSGLKDDNKGCVPTLYTEQNVGGNSAYLANGVVSLNVGQFLDGTLDSGKKGGKVSQFQLNGPWNSCDILKEVTVRHLGTGAISDIDKIYITDESMNILTPIQNFYGNRSVKLVLKSPYVIAKNSYNNFFVVINTATQSSTGTHQIAIYPDNNGASDFVLSSVGHIVAGAENIISTSFTIIP